MKIIKLGYPTFAKSPLKCSQCDSEELEIDETCRSFWTHDGSFGTRFTEVTGFYCAKCGKKWRKILGVPDKEMANHFEISDFFVVDWDEEFCVIVYKRSSKDTW